jgi:hypothetical protein
MDIIQRNFLRLLRVGAFGEEEQIEPMSAWKWRRLFQYALVHHVSALIYDGIQKCKDQFFMSLPDNLEEEWRRSTCELEKKYEEMQPSLVELYTVFSQQQLRPILIKGQRIASLYDRPDHRLTKNVEIFFPFKTQGKKADAWASEHGTHLNNADKNALIYEWNGLSVEHHHRIHRLTNQLLNQKMQNIVEEELRTSHPTYITINGIRVEVCSNTLELLLIFMRIAHHILNNGVSMKHLVDMGIFLRKAGDKVDFIKLQEWISQLHITKIAAIIGSFLVQLFHFSPEEIPFMPEKKDVDIDGLLREMFTLQNQQQSTDWYFQQGKDIFVHSTNSSAMMWHMQHSAKYAKFYPAESITNFFTSFVHSLSHIEE